MNKLFLVLAASVAMALFTGCVTGAKPKSPAISMNKATVITPEDLRVQKWDIHGRVTPDTAWVITTIEGNAEEQLCQTAIRYDSGTNQLTESILVIDDLAKISHEKDHVVIKGPSSVFPLPYGGPFTNVTPELRVGSGWSIDSTVHVVDEESGLTHLLTIRTGGAKTREFVAIFGHVESLASLSQRYKQEFRGPIPGHRVSWAGNYPVKPPQVISDYFKKYVLN